MVKVYMFHPEFFYYKGEKEARLDPIEGQPMLPDEKHDSRTAIAPPPAEDGKTRIFDRETQKWLLVDDMFETEKNGDAEHIVYDKTSGRETRVKLGYNGFNSVKDDVESRYTKTPSPSKYHRWNKQKDDWEEDVVLKEKKEKANQRVYELNIDRKTKALQDKLKKWNNDQIDDFVENADMDQLKEVIAGFMKMFAFNEEN